MKTAIWLIYLLRVFIFQPVWLLCACTKRPLLMFRIRDILTSESLLSLFNFSYSLQNLFNIFRWHMIILFPRFIDFLLLGCASCTISHNFWPPFCHPCSTPLHGLLPFRQNSKSFPYWHRVQ